MVQLRGNLGSGRSLGIPSISLEIKVKFPKTLEIGGACVQTSWPRTWACRRTRGASWRPSRGQAVTWDSSGQKTSASRLDCLARQRLGGQWRWTRAVLLEGNRLNSFNFPKSLKVGPKLGEQCLTQVTTSASSGDLQPTLGEEPRAPSGARPACCLPLQLTVLRSLGERRDQVPGVPPVALGDLAHHQVSPHSQSAPAQRQHSTSKLSALWCLALSQQLFRLYDLGRFAPQRSLWLCLPKQGFGDFSQGNRHLLAGGLAACSLYLKASKNGTSDLSRNASGAQVWRVTKHRPC